MPQLICHAARLLEMIQMRKRVVIGVSVLLRDSEKYGNHRPSYGAGTKNSKIQEILICMRVLRLLLTIFSMPPRVRKKPRIVASGHD